MVITAALFYYAHKMKSKEKYKIRTFVIFQQIIDEISYLSIICPMIISYFLDQNLA